MIITITNIQSVKLRNLYNQSQQYIYLAPIRASQTKMNNPLQNNKLTQSINHSLTSFQLQQPPSFRQQPPSYSIPTIEQTMVQKKQFNPYKLPKYHNPLTERSRKHRLVEDRNTEIEKSNRLLFEKIRRIKMKNMYHSERKIGGVGMEDGEDGEGGRRVGGYDDVEAKGQHSRRMSKLTSDLELPQITSHRTQHPNKPPSTSSRHSTSTISNKLLSMNSTKSHLTNILDDRQSFVQNYFNDLHSNRMKKLNEKQLAIINTENGWKVRVLMVGEESLLLVGKKGRNELTKKYRWEKVRERVEAGLEAWVRGKFGFQE